MAMVRVTLEAILFHILNLILGTIDSLTYAPPSVGAPSVKVAVVWVSSYLTLVAASNVADPPADLILTCCDQYLRNMTWPSTHVPNLSCERVGSSRVSTSGTSRRGWAQGATHLDLLV